MNKKISISLLCLLILAGTAHAALRVTDLRTEQLKNPLGIDICHPRLGWRIESDEQNVMQTAYHILVASSPELPGTRQRRLLGFRQGENRRFPMDHLSR